MPPVNRNEPVRAKSSESRYTLMEFMREFPDDATCLDWLWRNRYSADGEHADCPICQRQTKFKRYGTSQQRQSWTCTSCGHHIHPTAGTIFHKSSTSLHLWFYGMYLMTSTRCGISGKQLEREIGVTYKTAWRMFNQIRGALVAEAMGSALDGTVEIDETWIGGKPRYRAGGPQPARRKDGTRRPGRRTREESPNKKPVIGMVERGGQVRVFAVDNVGQGVAIPLVANYVLPSAIVYTDSANAYDSLVSKGYAHQRIHHEAKVYVDGDVHTNTIEGFWSLVKRGIDGVYHAVSAKHLQGYLSEYAWRYNHRHDARTQFETLLLRTVGR
ncbi:MAG: IS1595 family transposase [Dehalococcoidia bacterium]